MKSGLTDVDVTHHAHAAHVVVQTAAEHPAPASVTMPPVHWNDWNSHFTDQATLGICRSCTAILILTQCAMNVSQSLVCLSVCHTVRRRWNTSQYLLVALVSTGDEGTGRSLERIFRYPFASVQCTLLE